MPLSTRVSGAWKNLSAVSVKVNGAWKKCNQIYVKVNGVWKPCFTTNGFQFTICTNADAELSSNKIGAIPFHLYGTSGVTLTVDWGDGNTSTLTESNYKPEDSRASTHTYSSAGTYTITVEANDWTKMYWLCYNSNRLNNAYAANFYFRYTLISVESAIPKLKGIVYYYSKGTGTYTRRCEDNWFDALFQNCTHLTSVSTNLLDNITTSTSFDMVFDNCSSLGSFTLTVNSPNVETAWNFCNKKSGTTRIVKVPNNSTTKTTFSNVASEYGLTIQNL